MHSLSDTNIQTLYFRVRFPQLRPVVDTTRSHKAGAAVVITGWHIDLSVLRWGPFRAGDGSTMCRRLFVLLELCFALSVTWAAGNRRPYPMGRPRRKTALALDHTLQSSEIDTCLLETLLDLDICADFLILCCYVSQGLQLHTAILKRETLQVGGQRSDDFGPNRWHAWLMSTLTP